jgi:DNA-directed RNA polymerase alpha subunit
MSDSGRKGQDGGELELSVRTANAIGDLGATTVGELVRFTDEEMLETRCFGETTLKEVKEKLAQIGLWLGMKPDEMRGRPGLHARLVTRGKSGATQPISEAEHEGACCGHCEDASRKARERIEWERKLQLSIAELELSVRATNSLESEGITTVKDLVIRSDEELLEVRNFGETTLKEVKARLADLGLRLGMKLAPPA